ncbi:hypothetical protein TIFTF001_011529 [Ficus carica]|uniref:Uncharacterized protein n=1 Tax=Ficus carica TaxID=3494 RepID=A0AA87ZYS8_FICCA|nr:hypothetical protein TIFTF001_011529 [Ficus carica]
MEKQRTEQLTTRNSTWAPAWTSTIFANIRRDGGGRCAGERGSSRCGWGVGDSGKPGTRGEAWLAVWKAGVAEVYLDAWSALMGV